jgi:hypothetical protein
LDPPRRPPDHEPPARCWEKRGYHREPNLKAVFSWRDLDDDAETAKPMTFWMKRLETPGWTRKPEPPHAPCLPSSSRFLHDAHSRNPLPLTPDQSHPPLLRNGNNP